MESDKFTLSLDAWTNTCNKIIMECMIQIGLNEAGSVVFPPFIWDIQDVTQDKQDSQDVFKKIVLLSMVV